MKKVESIGNRFNKGTSTLEILLAFAILTLSITAVVVIGFGNQTVSADAEVSEEALMRARKIIEDARTTARKDFFLLQTAISSEYSGTLLFNDSLTVLDLTQCKKEVTSTVSWDRDGQDLFISLTTLLTDIVGVKDLGGDCDVVSLDEWDNPNSPESVNITGQSNATEIDAQNGYLYLTTDPGGHGKDNFFIYKFDSDTLTLTEQGSFEAYENLNNIDVAGDYAYVVTTGTEGQLAVIDITDSLAPYLVSSSTLPDLTNGVGRSIVYYKERVYVGTQYVACAVCLPERNNEFHIYDVSNPSSPTWLGSLDVDHNINDIAVQGNYAYLATSDNTGELMVVDITDPTSMEHPDDTGMKYDTSGNQDGYAIYAIGNRVYLGLRRSGDANSLADFYAFDISDPENITLFGSRDIGLNNNAEIVGIRVRGGIGFLAVNQPTFGFKLINILDSTLPDHVICTSSNFSENTSGIDMEGNFVFTSNESNAEIRVITDQASLCPA